MAGEAGLGPLGGVAVGVIAVEHRAQRLLAQRLVVVAAQALGDVVEGVLPVALEVLLGEPRLGDLLGQQLGVPLEVVPVDGAEEDHRLLVAVVLMRAASG